MTQYKDTTTTAERPQRASRGIIEWLTTVMLFAFLLAFALWLISCQPSQASINNLQNITGLGDNEILSSKTNNGKPYRYLLAFFVRKSFLAPHAGEMVSTNSPIILSQGNTIIFEAMHSSTLPTAYDGFTRPNKIAERRISRDSFCWAIRDEPITPLLNFQFNNVVNFSIQNQQGGHYHA